MDEIRPQLSSQAIEEALINIVGGIPELTLAYSDSLIYGTGVARMVQWSIPSDPFSWEPTWMYIHPRQYRLLKKVRRETFGHYKNTFRWRYLVKRGARK